MQSRRVRHPGKADAGFPVWHTRRSFMPRTGASSRAALVLSRLPSFSGLDAATLEDVARAATSRHYDAGQVIYLEGEPATALFILESGWVKATRMSTDGREQALSFLRPVDVFGDIAVFTGTSYPGTVVALEDVEAWTIDGATLLDLTARHPQLALAFLRRLAERVLYFIGLVEDLSLRSVEARLASTLLKNAETREGRLIVPRRSWTTFDEMAVRLGTVRDVLSRALHTLENEGLLRVGRHEITLLDPHGLEKRGQI
jgi:CRP-like cAMP-binding protein